MIKLYEEPGNGFVGIHFDEDLNAWVMHMDCKDWSVETFKRYRKVWKTIIIPQLKNKGITEIYGLCESTKAVKFNIMFGVYPTGHEVTTTDGMKQVLTKGVF
jgi:hypothetical protein